MRECFCLLLFTIHFTEGCEVSDQYKAVTGYSGGSVLLPCTCKDSQSKPESFSWSYYNKTQDRWIEVFKDEKYKNKLKLFNQSSPANLSLLISDLRKQDEGDYWCQTSNKYTVIRVTMKGCDLDQNKQSLQVMGHSGESVVLPCSCSELKDKARHLKWTFTPLNHRTEPVEVHPKEKSEQHSGRVKLLNEISPGNLSLLISNLTKEDEGEYRCSVLQQHIKITLSGQETPTTEQPQDDSVKQYFILVSVLTVLLLLGFLTLIYWMCRGRRPDQIMTNDGQVPVCNENEKTDEVTYSSVVYIKTTAKRHTQTVMAEH